MGTLSIFAHSLQFTTHKDLMAVYYWGVFVKLKVNSKAIIGHDFMDYKNKTVLILGGGDGGILNMLRTRHQPKVFVMSFKQKFTLYFSVH